MTGYSIAYVNSQGYPNPPPPPAESTRHILLTGGTEGEEKSGCYFIKLQVLFCSFCFVSREARALWSRE